jgi:SAM-dependent methyltransferase
LTHDAQHWDERYAAADPAHLSDPDSLVVELLATIAPGRALDLATGRGRHAIWLAAQGWDVTAVDFSVVGIQLAANGAAARQPRRRVAPLRGEPSRSAQGIEWLVADVRSWQPSDLERDLTYDLVLCAFVHLDPPDFARVRTWLAPGGRLVVVSHAPDAADGPGNPAYRYDEPQLRAAAEGLTIERLDSIDGRIVLLARATQR